MGGGGGKLTALNKPDGGIRPIAIGYYWRRLAAKCANKYALVQLESYFAPLQLGADVSGGCEAAIYAVRRFLDDMSNDWALVKIDFSNAFNCISKKVLLETVSIHLPELYKFCHLSYANHTSLAFGEFLISSEVGVQQGDPLGPLLFCLDLQSILQSLGCPLRVGYMDDLTLGGSVQSIADAVQTIIDLGLPVGLRLNPSKCEIIGYTESLFGSCPAQIQGGSACLLGAPLGPGPGMDDMLASRCDRLERTMARLKLLSLQDGLLILRAAVDSPMIMNVIRAAPCTDNPLLVRFDSALRSGLSAVINCDLTELAWIQASLPIRDGGLGVRSVVLLGPSAFLASAAATLTLQNVILGECVVRPDPNLTLTLTRWMEMFNSTPIDETLSTRQRSWDAAAIGHCNAALDRGWSDPTNTARLLAARDVRSGRGRSQSAHVDSGWTMTSSASQQVSDWVASCADFTHVVTVHRSMPMALMDFPADKALVEVLATVWSTISFIVL